MQTVVRLRFCTALPISPSFWEQCMAIHTSASPISWTIISPCSCRTCSALTWSFIWRLWHAFGAGSFWIPQVLLFTSTAAVLFVFYPFFFLLTFCCYRCPDCRRNVSVFFFPTGRQIFLVKQQGLVSTFVSLQLSPLWCQVCWQSLALCCHLLRRLKQTHCSDTPWHQLVRWATLNPWICKFYMVITIQDRRNQLEWTGRDSTKDAWGHLSHIFRCMNVLFVGRSNSLKHGLSWTLNTCTIHMRHQHIKCLEMDFFPWWNYQ